MGRSLVVLVVCSVAMSWGEARANPLQAGDICRVLDTLELRQTAGKSKRSDRVDRGVDLTVVKRGRRWSQVSSGGVAGYVRTRALERHCLLAGQYPDAEVPSSKPATVPETAPAARTKPGDGSSPQERALREARSLLVLATRQVGETNVDIASLTARIAQSVTDSTPLSVSTIADLERLAVLENERQLMGCAADQQCLARIAAAVDADLVLVSTLGRVGDSLLLNLSLLTSSSAAPIRRSGAAFTDLERLHAGAATVVADLMGHSETSSAQFRLPAGEQVSFAVFDLEPAGVASAVALNLTQVLSVELKRVEGAQVISRDDVVAMLQLEQERSILACLDDATCIAEIGGALGVDKLVVGTVGKLAESYVVSLRLIDARSVHVDNRVSETYRGQEEQLIRAVRHAGRRLLGVDGSGSGFGSLALASDQHGVSVHVDGEVVGDLPMPPVPSLPVGKHTARLSKDGYLDWQSEFFIDAGEATPLWASLQPMPRVWYQEWWVWAIVGVAAVAGGAASVYVLTREEVPVTPGGNRVVSW